MLTFEIWTKVNASNRKPSKVDVTDECGSTAVHSRCWEMKGKVEVLMSHEGEYAGGARSQALGTDIKDWVSALQQASLGRKSKERGHMYTYN